MPTSRNHSKRHSPQHIDTSYGHHSTMATSEHLKSGSTSSQHTWAWSTKVPLLLEQAETAPQTTTDTALRNAGATMEEAKENIKLAAELRYILISSTSGTAATVCKQHPARTGFEMHRQPTTRFSIPKGTMSIGYLTRLDSNSFAEAFATWEFELAKCETNSGQTLPDSVKIAVLLNETKGPLQQHLQLQYGALPLHRGISGTGNPVATAAGEALNIKKPVYRACWLKKPAGKLLGRRRPWRA